MELNQKNDPVFSFKKLFHTPLDKKIIITIIFLCVAIFINCIVYARAKLTHRQRAHISILNSEVPAGINQHRVKEWQLYVDEKNGFQIQLPSEWPIVKNIGSSLPLYFKSTTAPDIQGIGIPPVGSMWINILKGECNKLNNDFVLSEKPDIAKKIVCKKGFKIILGLWQKDPKLNSHKDLLNKIGDSFN